MTTLARRQGGFSLIELMVAIAIGLALLALLATVFSNTSGSRTELDRATRMMENARFAADSIGDDIRHAGYFGELRPLLEDPDPLKGTKYQTVDPCLISVDPAAHGFHSASLPHKLPLPLQGYDDLAAGLACLDDRVAGQDVLAVRRVSSTAIDLAVAPGAVLATNLYVQASGCQFDPEPILFKVENNAAALDLRTANCSATKSRVRRFFTRSYYLSSCNVCSPSDNIPTLKRFEVVNGNEVITALAEGVIAMQFEYGFDTSGDGEPDVFRTDLAPGGPPPPEDGKWQNVVAVRTHLLVRGPEPSSVLDGGATRTFNLGPAHLSTSCTPGYRCRLVSTTFRLNNVAGRRETP